jgi:hypothetical protein
MARIELRDATIYLQDGLSGSATINEATPGATDTTCNILSPVLNTTTTNLVPVGARFTVNTVNNVTTYTVTERTPTDSGPTTEFVFTPAWGAETPANADIITFLPQRLEIKIGEGNLTWSEAKEYEYLLDRGDLDTVKEGDEQPLEISLEFVYEHVTAGTGEDITPVDALKQLGDATEWVSSAADQCEPFAVDIVILQCVPCGTTEDEEVVFADFRYESLDYDLEEATIATGGRCNVSEATATRADYGECA